MTVIEASSARCKTLADGTLQLTVNIEPRDAISAFTLFGSPGVALGIAALKNSQESPKKARGGTWSQWVGIRCGEERFQKWLGVESADAAAVEVRRLLDIRSRSEIDNDPNLRQDFEDYIRKPYAKYCAENP
jgi:hypothetical protein